MRLRQLLMVLPALALMPASHGTAQLTGAQPAPNQPRYVAMGSSYAAGPNIGQSADTPPNRCARSAANYAHRVAQARQLALTDVTCSGATTAHILGPWGAIAPQIDAITPDTAVVTLTIGGNDLGYMTAIGVMRCPRSSQAERQRYFGGTCPAPKAISAQDETTLAEHMASIIMQIRQKAPAARILLVQYFALMPASGNCPATGLTDAEVPQIRAIGRRLAALTAQVARKNGAQVVPLDRVSADHALCSAQPWMNGGAPDMAAHDGAPYHPNAAGMAGAAEVIARSLR
jgi:lysophospholipase L1-like esterase